MSLTDRQYLGTVLLRNLEGTFTTDELDEFISREGDVTLAYARALEVEADKVAFSFSAGDVSADKGRYYDRLVAKAKQVRADHDTYSTELSSVVSWSGSDTFGTAGVESWVDLDYNEPTL